MAKPTRGPTRVSSVLENPRAQAIARVYADSLLHAAETVGVEQVLEEYESFLDNVLEPNPELEKLLNSVLLGRDEKLGLIDRVIAPRASELFTNFLRVLARHDRLDLLRLILSESRRRYEIQMGRGRVQLISAMDLPPQAQEKIRQRLDDVLPFSPILETEIDPSLIGGIVIRVGDRVYDSSIKLRMKQLRSRLRQRSVNEIQSGRDRFSHPEGD